MLSSDLFLSCGWRRPRMLYYRMLPGYIRDESRMRTPASVRPNWNFGATKWVMDAQGVMLLFASAAGPSASIIWVTMLNNVSRWCLFMFLTMLLALIISIRPIEKKFALVCASKKRVV